MTYRILKLPPIKAPNCNNSLKDFNKGFNHQIFQTFISQHAEMELKSVRHTWKTLRMLPVLSCEQTQATKKNLSIFLDNTAEEGLRGIKLGLIEHYTRFRVTEHLTLRNFAQEKLLPKNRS